jgi:hypothetical protein
MAILNFPSNPTIGDTYEENGITYTWDGEKWTASSGGGSGGGSGAEYWDRTGTTLSPVNAGDGINVANGQASINAGGEYFTKDRSGYFIKTTNDYGGGIFSTVDTQNADRPYIVINSGSQSTIACDEQSQDVRFCGSPAFGGSLNTPVAQISGDGSATFDGNVLVDKYLTVTNTPFSSDAKVQIQGDADVAISVYPAINNAARTIELRHDGSASFANNGVYILRENQNPVISYAPADNTNGLGTTCYDNKYHIMYGATSVWNVNVTGQVGTRNIVLELEPDNAANFSAEGEYTGPTLDVKELLLTLQTAATRIATLEAKVQTLESDHTTLMNNNNGGGY